MARPNTPPQEPLPPGTRWLVFVTQLPTDDPAGRMKVLRTLETLGCAPLRDGAYLLPDTTENRGGLSKLARFVASINGKTVGTTTMVARGLLFLLGAAREVRCH